MPSISYRTLYESNDPVTGSLLSSADTIVAVVVTGSVVITTGSWYNLANTWGGNSTMSGSFETAIVTGSWYGIDYSYGVRTMPTESIDRFTLTDEANPSINQGVGAGEWDPFPIIAVPPAESPPERDTTRFRKSYSSQRLQPRRVRYIKR